MACLVVVWYVCSRHGTAESACGYALDGAHANTAGAQAHAYRFRNAAMVEVQASCMAGTNENGTQGSAVTHICR